MNETVGGWQFWIDRGGTFTDIVAITPQGEIKTRKLLSENSSLYEDAAIAGIQELLQSHPESQRHIASVKMGTTVATNALLERRGAATVLVTTVGFADLLRIGTQQRPDIFALDIRLPDMLHGKAIEAMERLGADGTTVIPLNEERLQRDLTDARSRGYVSVAIAFMHGYRYPAHERRAAEIAARIGFSQISVSHEVSPLIKLVDRGDTTVVDAYLTPVLASYVASVRDGLAGQVEDQHLLFMQSHGGLVRADRFRGRDSILSGPAGGVVGMAAAGGASGFGKLIGFDMGGTSTDVSVYPDKYERTGTAVISGIRIATPMLRINTVAAGGGSILKYQGGRLQVGPESAGAQPGPVSYRNGGPLTLTDANVLLGRLQSDCFPSVFGPSGDQALDPEAVRAAFDQLVGIVEADTGRPSSAAELAAGFLRIAVENMAQAIEQISVQRGHDLSDFTLSCFGGAGGQHACQVADALGLERVVIDPMAGVLSAYGIGVADRRSISTETIAAALDETSMERMTACARDCVRNFDREFAGAAFEYRAVLNLAGTDTLLTVPYTERSAATELAAEFESEYRHRFGFVPEGASIVVQSIEVEAIVRMPRPADARLSAGSESARAIAHRSVWFAGRWQQAPIYSRDTLGAGSTIEGPAVITEPNATTVIEAEWRARVDDRGALVLERVKPRPGRESIGTTRDPIMLELFNNQFMHVAERMGAVLEQTAHSVNIKERLDYSCAVFDRGAGLIANAPHVPVHLGSMGDSVRSVLDNAAEIRPGDAFMLNAPYKGGTHLPDITVVSPFFEPGSTTPNYIVASRAHHADVGGVTPGSMPAGSRHIEEEGIVFDCMRIVSDGRFAEAEIREALARGPHPARNPDQNIADLKAQLAANARGAQEISGMLDRFGSDVVRAYMQHVQDNAEECMRRAIRLLHNGKRTVELDGGERISVSIAIDADAGEATVDFRGTSGISSGNYNAPASIAHAAVLYVFRTLIDESIPLNAGCLKPIRIRLPANSLLRPSYPAAVVAGNVETSQCIADALLAALGVEAASQGTMNNFSFGDAAHQYYETICGGCGAGRGFAGASAVHSHMTNSRMTDPEILEQRFPVRLRQFSVRSGSGGAGRWPGGNGVVREIEFLSSMQGSILSNRRRTVPFGLEGGSDGAPGRNLLIRSDGRVEQLGAAAEMQFERGDRFKIETPGGGGFGSASD